ncbi:Uu.00g098190.m01.CDS01 [Anthostomella pinea]|uniref:Uu.00g098190.m01.CDS01 n=1 Tax=Anthostomella pinea TaxID=933095 RepID=A0AAI8YF35_9PEZI|nr:Uu.00g098190.m01.CDS01 [Anthostomella pinea]
MYPVSVITTILLAVAATHIAADFWIYEVSKITNAGGLSSTEWGFGFFDAPPDCDRIVNGITEVQAQKSDVSGNKHGVRPYPYRVEQRHGAFHDLTFLFLAAYANRDWAMVDLHDNVEGRCGKDTSKGYTCTSPGTNGATLDYFGSSLIFCTSQYNADSVNE